MVPGPSVKELVLESPNEKEDSITQISIGQLFKPGITEYTRIGSAGLKDAPPLPARYVLFKDLVFQVKTEAVTAGSQLTVFRILSAVNEADFNRLRILHLEDDEMSPSGQSWAEATIYEGGWNEHFHFVSKGEYDALKPDSKSKRIAAVTHEFGLFVLALAPESGPERTEPFPEVTLKATSSPQPAQAGQKVTHTITLTNTGTSSAAEVDVKEVISIYLEYVSATPNQGVCKQKGAANNVVCHLGALSAGASATIIIVSRTRPALMMDDVITASNTLDVVFKRNVTDFVDMRGQIKMQQLTSSIVKAPYDPN